MRKIGIAMIGVFGAAMEEMQVSLTLVLVFFIILLTAIKRPYGEKENGMLLQRLEVSTLCLLFLTLWAASVFTVYPRCEVRESESLWWCEMMSILVGLADAALVVVVILLFVWLKGANASCLDRCFGKLPAPARDTLTRVGSRVVLRWDMWLGGEAAVQARVRARTVESRDSSMMDNPFAHRREGGGGGGGTAGTVATLNLHADDTRTGVAAETPAAELSIEMTAMAQERRKRRSTQLPANWKKHRTEEGDRYYTNDETYTSQWTPPEGATWSSSEVAGLGVQ